ncbi:bacterial transcriptional activator domain-containing protein [Lysinibacillus sp. MHQ-1]|nr:bacterial transcriptional activator domain-containing protein [Lysinibacillus sp. MHQ-1]
MRIFSRLEFPSISLIHQCLAIYKNGLFVFDDYEWAKAYKDRLTKSYIELLEKRVPNYRFFQILIKQLNFLHALLEYDPYNEQKLEHYLYTLIQAGLHEQAHKIFLTYKQKLKEDLALPPSSTLLEISKKIICGK